MVFWIWYYNWLAPFDPKSFVTSVKSLIYKYNHFADVTQKYDSCNTTYDVYIYSQNTFEQLISAVLNTVNEGKYLEALCENRLILPILQLFKTSDDRSLSLLCLEIVCKLSEQYNFKYRIYINIL